MKTNGKDSNGGSLCGVPGATCTSGDWRQAYANYLVKYIQLYQVRLWLLTAFTLSRSLHSFNRRRNEQVADRPPWSLGERNRRNTHRLRERARYKVRSAIGVGERTGEQQHGLTKRVNISTSYASMQSTGEQSANFVKVLHPTLEKAGLGNVSITCCEATGWRAQSQMTLALRDAGIEDLVGVITGHTYTSGITGPQPTSRKSWVSECADLSGHWSTTWDTPGGSGDGLTWANNIYTGLTTGNLSACKLCYLSSRI
ncbi:hypothetical protein VTK73DRAFT_1837 [Phialemonium thermophilum]|uniref:Uncharacterized protein n=1 Tax=Phialemonium thermophilum TaxID=223376 RepID=A0ABR3X7F6_9PEZI